MLFIFIWKTSSAFLFLIQTWHLAYISHNTVRIFKILLLDNLFIIFDYFEWISVCFWVTEKMFWNCYLRCVLTLLNVFSCFCVCYIWYLNETIIKTVLSNICKWNVLSYETNMRLLKRYLGINKLFKSTAIFQQW